MSELLTQLLGSFGGLIATVLQGVSGLALFAVLFISPLVGIAMIVLTFVLYPKLGLDCFLMTGVIAVIAAMLKMKFFPDEIEKQIRAFQKKRPPETPKNPPQISVPYRKPLEVTSDWERFCCPAACVSSENVIFDVFEEGDRYYVERTGVVLDVFTHREDLEYTHLLLVNMDTLESRQYVFKLDDRLKMSILYEPVNVKLHSKEDDWYFFVEKKGKKVYAIPAWSCKDALKNVNMDVSLTICDFGNDVAYLPHFIYVNTRVKAVHTWGRRGEYAQHSVVETEDGRRVVVPVSYIKVGDRIGYDAYTGLYEEMEYRQSGNYFDKFYESWICLIQK